MIKNDKGSIAIVGSQSVICAEFSMLVNEMKGLFADKLGEEEATEIIVRAFETGLKPIEEIKADVKENKKALADLLGMLADILGKEDKKNGSEQ